MVDAGADVGLAFDGDADRLGAVAPDGTIIWADRLMLLFARSVLDERPGSEIIFDVKCSQVLPADIAAMAAGPRCGRPATRSSSPRLRETGAALAGEMSGHIIFNDRWGGFDDGLYAGARLCELLAADSRPAADVFGELPDTVNTPELRLEMEEGDHFRLMEVLAAMPLSGCRDQPNRRCPGGFRRRLRADPAVQYHARADPALRGHERAGAGAHPGGIPGGCCWNAGRTCPCHSESGAGPAAGRLSR